MEPLTFDLQRIFIGEHPPFFLFEIAFRTAVMYGYTLLATRFMGKRGMGQITTFEFVVIIALGSAVGDPMLYADIPLIYGIIVVTVIVLMQKLLNGTTNLFPKFEQVVEGESVQFISEGRVVEGALESESVSMQEFYMELRMKGIKNTGEIESAYLEPTGQFSIFKYPNGQEREGVSVLPQ